MAVNNANLHKLPLKSTLNMNRFENEINDWKQYINLNSPVYGGVLSNFYKKNVELANGHHFITYDKKNRLWTKKYNEETTNTDVYCGNRLITSFNNKTAEMQELERDYGIIGGTKEYPIYDTDYPEYNISTKFVTYGNTGLFLVLYYKANSKDKYVDIYECNNNSKVLQKTFHYVMEEETYAKSYFINGFVNENGFLIYSILPKTKINYNALFAIPRTDIITLEETAYWTKYSTVEPVYFTDENENAITVESPKDCTGVFERYDTYVNNQVQTNRVIAFVENQNVYANNHGVLIPIPDNKTDSQYLADTKEYIGDELCADNSTLQLDIFHKSIVSNDKLLMFGEVNKNNAFNIPYGEGEFCAAIDKNTSMEFEGADLYIRVNTSIYPRQIGIFQMNNRIKRCYFVGDLEDSDLPITLRNIVGDVSSVNSLAHDIREYYKKSEIKLFDKENETELSKYNLVYVSSRTSTDVTLDINKVFGFVWNEIKELNITLDISPVSVNIDCKNIYKPVFHGYYYNNIQGGSPRDPSYTNLEFLVGSEAIDNFSTVKRYYDYDTELQVVTNQNSNEIDFSDDNTITKCAESTDDTYLLMGEIEKHCVINLCFNISTVGYTTQYIYSIQSAYLLNSKAYYDITRGVVKDLQNYKVNIGKLGVTYTLGEPFAITRGIMNLYNQILEFCSAETINDETYIYFINNSDDYCCIRSEDKEGVLDSFVVDDFIIFRTSDYGNNNFNAIDMSNIESFPTSLDWNSRNSVFLTRDCGLHFEDKIICYIYNEQLSSIKLEEPGEEVTQSIIFISSINERFLAVSTNLGIGANWCSSLVGTQFLTDVSDKLVNADILNSDSYLGTMFDFSPDDYLSDYAKFYINVYTNSLGSDDTSASACFYRFSIPLNNPDLEGLEGQVSFPFEGNVLYNISLFDEIFTTKYFPEWFVKIGEDVYNMMKNGSTLQPVFSYELLTGVTVDGIFVINGSVYGYTKDYIMPLSYSDGVVTRGDPVLNKEELFFIESSPYVAYFYSYQNRSVYAFSGDNTMAKLFESNRIEDIHKAYYNTATQDIWCSTNDGTLIIHSDNTFIKLNNLQFDEIGILKDVLYVLTRNNELLHYSYNFDEDFEKVPIELETEFFGVDDFTASVNDCVYIRLVTDEGHDDWVGDVELMCKTLTQISKFSETKKFHIEKDTWDKDTKTILLRYQPKYQEGIGFGIKLKSDFPMSGIYINSTPVAIANSKHNV